MTLSVSELHVLGQGLTFTLFHAFRMHFNVLNPQGFSSSLDRSRATVLKAARTLMTTLIPRNFTQIEYQYYDANLQRLGNKKPTSREHLRTSRAPCKTYCKTRRENEKMSSLPSKKSLKKGIFSYYFGRVRDYPNMKET